MTNLRDPVKRTALCLSCHLGDAATGKVVTHEMYAAGHPPLPPFEVASFGAALPQHWETLDAKYARLSKLKDFDAAKFKKLYGGFDGAHELEQARDLVVGAVVALRESARLTEALAAPAKAGNEPTWPELAVFDCYACHHELQSASWRQKRPLKGRPGRPTWRGWSTALIHLAMPGSKNELLYEFDVKRIQLDKAFDQTPFGDPREVAARAKEIVAWADSLMLQIRDRPFDRKHVATLLDAALKNGREAWPDFDSARQLGWGVRGLVGDLNLTTHAAYKAPLAVLQEALVLDLPQGQVPTSGAFLAEVLRRTNAYDPAVVRAALAELAKARATPFSGEP